MLPSGADTLLPPVAGIYLPVILASVTVLLGLAPGGGGFNVDLRTAVVHGAGEGSTAGDTIQPGSMFGYSVAQHIDQVQSWLLVGAPKAQTSQPNILQGGAIYRCPIEADFPCQIIPFDRRGNNIKYNGRGSYVPIENKTHQWFGATVASSATNGVIVGCAPRYVYFSERLDKREPVGNCLVLSNQSQQSKAYSPCQLEVDYNTRPDQYQKQDKAMFGMSAVVSHDGERMAVGAVGSYYWQGQLFSQDLKDDNNMNQTRQGHYSTDYSYMGYAVAIGSFLGNNTQDYVVGEPRGNSMVGMIAIYGINMIQHQNVSGTQLGEYFGAAVSVGDFNGDGLDDVAVGAPFYVKNYFEYETGRVVIYYQTRRRRLGDSPTILRGCHTNGCRFGFAVSSLGDINRDGYEDIVVGAPYAGEGRQGAVYIFHGNSNGMRTKPSQVIEASTINPFLKTFGHSVSGGFDLDKNAYTDVLIGAYSSDMAVFLRSRPILKVDMKVTITPSVIDLEDKRCQNANGAPIVCFSMETCMSYSGHKVPGSIALNVTLHIESDRPVTSRAFFMSPPKKETKKSFTVTLSKKTRECTTSMAYLKSSFRDKLAPITVDASYSLMETRLTGEDLTPVLDDYIPTTVRGNGEIKKDCGEDDVCIPNLIIRADPMTADYTLGTDNPPLDVHVFISNTGEGAYEAHVAMKLPQGTSYVNIYDVESELPVKCTPGKDKNGDDLADLMICDLGNPLPARAKVSFILRVTAVNMTGESDVIRFMMYANSTNPETIQEERNNFAEAVIPVKAITSIRLTGVSYPEQIFFNATRGGEILTEADIGDELTHLYELRNLGPSSIETTSIFIYWPSHLENDLDLLYLAVTPEVVQGNGKCRLLTHPVNSKNVSVLASDDEYEPSVSISLQQMLQRRHRRSSEGILSELLGSTGTEKRGTEKQAIRKAACTSRSRELCTTIQCDTGSMNADDSILIRVRSRVWVRSFADLPYRALIVTSSAEAQVMAVPYAVHAEEYSVATFKVNTYIAALDAGPEYGQLEIWVIALAISGGFILLLLLTLLLWACGFFKREKHEDQEKLKPNGNSTAAHYDAIPTEEL